MIFVSIYLCRPQFNMSKWNEKRINTSIAVFAVFAVWEIRVHFQCHPLSVVHLNKLIRCRGCDATACGPDLFVCACALASPTIGTTEIWIHEFRFVDGADGDNFTSATNMWESIKWFRCIGQAAHCSYILMTEMNWLHYHIMIVMFIRLKLETIEGTIWI